MKSAALKRSWPFYVTVFLGAFLLFQVQPMLTKALLPGFGGSYLVWGAAMVFFQGVLLLGYAFAHYIQRKLGPVAYARLHLFLIFLPLLFLPFRFDSLGGGSGASLPLVIEVLRLLAIIAGLPFFALSMTAVILQRWFSVHPVFHDRNPYVLYSASNLGSLLALLTYPLMVEPFLNLQQQATIWTIAYAALVVMHLLCLPRPFPIAHRLAIESQHNDGADTQPLAPPRQMTGWLLLSAATCALLLAVTNILTFDVAAVPFLWILPLSVYLGTFVLAFRPQPWFPRWIRPLLYWAAPLGVMMDLMTPFRITPRLLPALVIHLGILFVVCLNANVVLARNKPRNHNQLTIFYLLIAVGGFCGGMAVSWIMPLISTRLAEYLGALMLCMIAIALADKSATPAPRFPRWSTLGILVATTMLVCILLPWLGRSRWQLEGHQAWIITAVPMLLILRTQRGNAWGMSMLLLSVLMAAHWTGSLGAGDRTILRLRNYYGIYRVFDRDGERFLQHGTTLHGRQYQDPERSRIPSSYFHPTTPAAALLTDPRLRFDHIGMTGLGTGALSAYAGEGQSFKIFEIDPDNVWVAERYFTYLEQARSQGAELEIVVGDGRLLMRDQTPNSFDMLILDAFSSGSIPVHLITADAFEEYLRVLKPDGVILLQISNRMLNIEPLIFAIARHLGVRAASATNAGNVHPDADNTHWMAMFNDSAAPSGARMADHLRRHGWLLDVNFQGPLPPPWTDRYSNLLRLIGSN